LRFLRAPVVVVQSVVVSPVVVQPVVVVWFFFFFFLLQSVVVLPVVVQPVVVVWFFFFFFLLESVVVSPVVVQPVVVTLRPFSFLFDKKIPPLKQFNILYSNIHKGDTTDKTVEHLVMVCLVKQVYQEESIKHLFLSNSKGMKRIKWCNTKDKEMMKLKVRVRYQTSKLVGCLYVPDGPERYEIVEVDTSLGREPEELIKREIGVKAGSAPEILYVYTIEVL
jgi:hypothetical protein